MSGNKNALEIEAYVYLKSLKAVPVKGVMSETDLEVIFTSKTNVATFRKESISAIIRDVNEESFNIPETEELAGFAIYGDSGQALGFNGWKVTDTTFVSKEQDVIQFFEPIAYVEKGPVMEVQEQETPTQEGAADGGKEDK